MTFDVEGVVDGIVGGNEALGLTLRLEPLHFSLSSSDGKMRILGPVVVSQSAWTMPLLATESFHRRRVGTQSVSDDGFRHGALVPEQFPQQFQRGGLVPPLLHENVEDLTFLVDGPPHVHPDAIDMDHHLVEMTRTESI